jgi:hypothetical protein
MLSMIMNSKWGVPCKESAMILFLIEDQDISFGIVTGYGLDDQDSIPSLLSSGYLGLVSPAKAAGG